MTSNVTDLASSDSYVKFIYNFIAREFVKMLPNQMQVIYAEFKVELNYSCFSWTGVY